MKMNYIYMATKRLVYMIIKVFYFQQSVTLKAPEDFRQIDNSS